jgi:FMN phosphatase YigB (HAD superfamily)
VLHVGDHPVNDLAGARRAGLSALLLCRDPGAAAAEPASCINSLLELPGRISIRLTKYS